jgi:hypothetical protein
MSRLAYYVIRRSLGETSCPVAYVRLKQTYLADLYLVSQGIVHAHLFLHHHVVGCRVSYGDVTLVLPHTPI